MPMNNNTKNKILTVLERAFPMDLSIIEVSKEAGFSEWTTSMYIKVLEAEGKVVLSRKIGKAKLYRLKK